MLRHAFSVGLILLLLVDVGCNFGTDEPTPAPTETNSFLLYSGPFFGLRRFSITGTAFMGDRLFVGSDRGLYEVVDGKFVTRFNWMPKWDVVENPFYDKINEYLWFEHTGLGKFVRFDGKNWSFVPIPSEERTRGDALAGFRMFNSRDSLYAYSPQGLWRWDETTGWQSQLINGLNCAGEKPGEKKECLLMAGAAGNDLVVVIRHASSISALLPDAPNKTQYDHICVLNERVCNDVPNPQGNLFFVKNIVSGNSKAVILTYNNELFAIEANRLDRVPSPDNIDNIVQSDSDILYATLIDGEVLKFSGEWKKLTERPLFPESSKKFAYIAEHDGKIAYAISGQNSIISGDCNIRGQSALWIIQNKEYQCIGF